MLYHNNKKFIISLHIFFYRYFIAAVFFQRYKKMLKECIRWYIQTRHKLGTSARDIEREISTAWPQHAVSHTVVYRWINSLKNDRGGEIKDKPRSGCPVTATSPIQVEHIKKIIDENPWITFDELETESSCSRNSIQRIIHEHLKYKKVASRWVPHELTDHNRSERVRICHHHLAKLKSGEWRICDIITGDESWFYHRQIGKKQSNKSWVADGQPPRTVVKRSIFEPKTMYTILQTEWRATCIIFG